MSGSSRGGAPCGLALEDWATLRRSALARAGRHPDMPVRADFEKDVAGRERKGDIAIALELQLRGRAIGRHGGAVLDRRRNAVGGLGDSRGLWGRHCATLGSIFRLYP